MSASLWQLCLWGPSWTCVSVYASELFCSSPTSCTLSVWTGTCICCHAAAHRAVAPPYSHVDDVRWPTRSRGPPQSSRPTSSAPHPNSLYVHRDAHRLPIPAESWCDVCVAAAVAHLRVCVCVCGAISVYMVPTNVPQSCPCCLWCSFAVWCPPMSECGAHLCPHDRLGVITRVSSWDATRQTATQMVRSAPPRSTRGSPEYSSKDPRAAA